MCSQQVAYVLQSTALTCKRCLLLQPPDLREGDEHGHAMAARLHAVEKHLRKNPLQGGTFYDKLQRSTCAICLASSTRAMMMQQIE